MGNDELNADDFKLIGDMSKEELIDELTAGYRISLQEADPKQLKEMVVSKRLTEIQNRLLKEAGLTIRRGIFGSHVEEGGDETTIS